MLASPGTKTFRFQPNPFFPLRPGLRCVCSLTRAFSFMSGGPTLPAGWAERAQGLHPQAEGERCTQAVIFHSSVSRLSVRTGVWTQRPPPPPELLSAYS